MHSPHSAGSPRSGSDAAPLVREDPSPITDAVWYSARGVSRFSRETGRRDDTAKFDPFPSHEIAVLQRGGARGDGPGVFYDVAAAYQRAVLPQCHSPVLRGDPQQARMRSQREQNAAEGKTVSAAQQLDLDPKVDFCSQRLSPLAHRFGPRVFSEGQRTQRFHNAAFTDPPEQFAYTTVLFEDGYEQPSSPRSLLVPRFGRTTGRDNHKMTWHTSLPQLESPDRPRSRLTAKPASRARHSRTAGDDGAKSDTDNWVDQYIPAVLKSGTSEGPRRGSRSDQRKRVTSRGAGKAKVHRRQPRGAEIHLSLGREVVPTFMRHKEPKLLTLGTDYSVVAKLTSRRAPSPSLAPRPFDPNAGADSAPRGRSSRPPLSHSGAAMGSAARRGMCDVDRITRDWVKRHKRELLAQEADAAAEGSPPAFSVSELLGDPAKLRRERNEAAAMRKKKPAGAVDLFLGSGRGDDVRALVGNPRRSLVARVRREVGL